MGHTYDSLYQDDSPADDDKPVAFKKKVPKGGTKSKKTKSKRMGPDQRMVPDDMNKESPGY